MRVKQISSLLLATGASTVGGMLVNVLNTHFLRPEQFADVRLIIAILNLLALVLPVGLFYSLGRMAASPGESEDLEVVRYATLPVTLGLAATGCFAIFAIAPLSEVLFNRDLFNILVRAAPFAGIYLLLPLLENVLQGRNRIVTLAIWRSAPSFAYLGACVAWMAVSGGFGPMDAISLQLAGIGVVGGCILWREGLIRLDRDQAKRAVGQLVRHTKGYGLPLQLGALANVSVGYIGIFILAHFAPPPEVAFFALAQTITLPLTIAGSAVGTTYFNSFVGSRTFPKIALIYACALSVLAFATYQVAIGALAAALFSESYASAIELARVMAIGYALHGLGDFFNRFLCARGLVRQVRVSAYVTGLVGVTAYCLGAVSSGAAGAAIAAVITSVTYLAAMAACAAGAFARSTVPAAKEPA